MKIFVLIPLGFTKLSHFSEMQDDALMHREGLKGQWWEGYKPHPGRVLG